MDRDSLLDLLLETANLKRLPRTGWLMRGVPHAESIADHSFGTAFTVLALAGAMKDNRNEGAGLDLEKALSVALLHDLAEVRLTDLPMRASDLISDRVKSRAEASAMAQLLAALANTDQLLALWQAFEDRASPEGCLVRDADKLDMMVQCLRYEQAGSRGLDEFWQAMDRRQWHYEISAELYARLKALRPVGTGSGV